MSVQLYHGDCLEFMRTLPAGSVDAVVTDPPYGIGERWSGEVIGTNGKSRLWGNGSNQWDLSISNEEAVLSLSRYPAIIWGGNFYHLPPVRGWLSWDKMQTFSGADFEMAWTNLDISPSIYRLSRIDGYVNQAKTRKQHPTEKPLPLILWCIERFVPPNATVLDPFMGSGTTGVACVQTGRNFIGCEIDAGYFEIAQRRIALAQKQPMLPGINGPAPQPEQLSLV